MNIHGSTALVTGATSGIGRATAIALARAGARVIVTGRNTQALAAIRDETDGTAVPADLANPADIERLAATALGGPAPVEILVNNAGIGWEGPFAAMPPEKIEDLVAVNLLGAARLTRALLPAMLERGRGHIVNVASIAGHVGVRDEALYAATKAALLTFSEGLRYEVQASGVRVTTVSPGVVDTDFFNRGAAARFAAADRGRSRRSAWRGPSCAPSSATATRSWCPAGCASPSGCTGCGRGSIARWRGGSGRAGPAGKQAPSERRLAKY